MCSTGGCDFLILLEHIVTFICFNSCCKHAGKATVYYEYRKIIKSSGFDEGV